MRSITIHDLDPDLDQRILNVAREKGVSLNKTIKDLLRQAVGLSVGGVAVAPDHTADFEEFCGSWNQQETNAFLAAVSEDRKIDPEDWK
jgi:hypothetical protein